MSTTFPNTIDQLTNPSATDSVAVVDHAAQHANANDAIEALEAKVGVDGSAVTTSHDYKLSEVTGTDKAVSKTATQTLTNKTLTSPTLTTPTIASFANATHTHEDAAGGGTLDEDALALTDVTTNNASATKHGFLKKLENTGIKFLRDDGTWQTPSAGTSMLTTIPHPNAAIVQNNGANGGGSFNLAISTSTTMRVGQIIVPFAITANKISFRCNGVSVAGTVKVSLFSEDGQTRLFSVTTASISASGVITTSLSAVVIAAGVYYITILPVSTASLEVLTWNTDLVDAGDLRNISSEPVIEGTVTVTADTVPSTITPGSITSAAARTLIVRLDN
jgi:hypothetical protein